MAAGDASTNAADTAFVQAAVAPAHHNVGRSLIHNGLMNIQQRGAGPFTASVYTLDRWALGVTTDAVSVTQVGFNDTTRAQVGDEAAKFALSNTFTGNAAAAAYSRIQQPIEDVRRLSGKTVTISFWAATAAGTLNVGISLIQTFGTGGSPSAPVYLNGQSVSINATWARYSVTLAVPSVAGKVLGSNNDSASWLSLWYSSGATNAAYAGNIGVQSGTVQMWGVQLEIGSVATPLEKLDPRLDLANCQRFYQTGQMISSGYLGGPGNGMDASNLLPVQMRAQPTITPNFITATNVTSQQLLSMGPHAEAIHLYAAAAATGGYTINVSYTASADL
jgi:hypothetical protein